MELKTFTLPNGIRLVHLPVAGPVAHCGVFIHAGTRDEEEGRHGVAHLIEHTIFKGTGKRSLSQVLNRLENVGADLNAYTTKEETCVHASFVSEHYGRALELFQDIVFNSVFPEKEIVKEKQVVMDEIRSYFDTPAEQVFDDFEDLLFKGHPLGRNILGTAKSLRALKRQDILDFIHTNYRLDEIVIASAGRIEFPKLVKLVMKYFNVLPERGTGAPRLPFTGYTPFVKNVKRRHTQVHCLAGSPAYPFGHEGRIPLALLNNILGGPIMNSRLSLALRERSGLTYHCESNYTAYSDAGLIHIYFGTDPVHYEKALDIVHRELRRLREDKLSTMQLHTVKKQLAGQLAIAGESNLAAMLAVGKSYLLQNRFDPVEMILERINTTTSEELLEIANEIFGERQLSRLTYMP
jgi:predicted Zn-dependent peptidase